MGPDRKIVAMTTYRDFVLIACDDGSMWIAVWTNGEWRYHRQPDFPRGN